MQATVNSSVKNSVIDSTVNSVRPKYFYFDLGNVLLYFDHDIAFRRMAKIAGCSHQDMRSIVMDGGLQIAYETGHISGQDFIHRISDQLGRSLPVEDMLEAAADMFVANVHILPVMQRIKEIGLPIGLLSNTCEAHWKWIVSNRYPQSQNWFRDIVLSYEVKSMKPDHGIYIHAEKLAGVAPEEIYFTDDREDNVQAALDRGWNAEVFVNADRLMKTIDSWA